MATYNLQAGDLLTLLESTLTIPTLALTLDPLIRNGDFSGPVTVETHAGPPGSGLPATEDDTVGAGSKVEIITTPGSTTTLPITVTPTVGGLAPAEQFNFINLVGHETFVAGDQDVTINDMGTIGGDTLIGGAGYEKLIVNAGANVLMAGSGHNTLIGGSGHDTLLGGSGDSTLLGGGYSSVVAGSGNDRLIGGQRVGASDTLIGGAGKDLLRGIRGNDSLVGGSGLNTLFSGIGDDTLVGGGQSRLIARAQTSILGGHATLITSSLSGGHDTLKAVIGDASMQAVAGDNRLVAGSGDDTVTLGSGHDTLIGGTGNLTLDGGAGVSRVVLDAGAVTDSITGGSGAMTIVSKENSTALQSNSSTAVGGVHQLQFSDGQTIIINDANSNITIHFADGGSTPV